LIISNIIIIFLAFFPI